jgi:hypothetical protein
MPLTLYTFAQNRVVHRYASPYEAQDQGRTLVPFPAQLPAVNW